MKEYTAKRKLGPERIFTRLFVGCAEKSYTSEVRDILRSGVGWRKDRREGLLKEARESVKIHEQSLKLATIIGCAAKSFGSEVRDSI